MASAFDSRLEEHLTCSVCLEVYTEPLILGCLHTLCQSCTKDVTSKLGVKCPECREYTKVQQIRKDFKMESLISLHKQRIADSKDVNSISETVCDVCQLARKPAEAFCSDCEEVLCTDCSRAHRGMKVTQGHQLAPMDNQLSSKRQLLQEQLSLFKEERKGVQERIASNLTMINQAKHLWPNRVNTSKKKNKNGPKLLTEIEAVPSALQQQRQLLFDGLSVLDKKIDFYTDICLSSNIKVLDSNLRTLCDEVRKDLQLVRAHLPTLEGETKLSEIIKAWPQHRYSHDQVLEMRQGWGQLVQQQIEHMNSSKKVKTHMQQKSIIPTQGSQARRRFETMQQCPPQILPVQRHRNTDIIDYRDICLRGNRGQGLFIPIYPDRKKTIYKNQ